MNQPNFEKWNDMAKRMQEPFKAIADLNVKTLQGFSYLKPDDLTKIKNPEQLIEKQIDLAIENGQKALDYMQKSFQIFESTLHSVAKETKDEVRKAARDTREEVRKAARDTRAEVRKPAKETKVDIKKSAVHKK